jgi:hypothetical protein
MGIRAVLSWTGLVQAANSSCCKGRRSLAIICRKGARRYRGRATRPNMSSSAKNQQCFDFRPDIRSQRMSGCGRSLTRAHPAHIRVSGAMRTKVSPHSRLTHRQAIIRQRTPSRVPRQDTLFVVELPYIPRRSSFLSLSLFSARQSS